MAAVAPLLEHIRRALAGAVLALVAWQALQGALEVKQELGRRPWTEHVRILEARPRELIQARLGADFELWRTLRERLAPDALVRVSFLNRRADYSVLRRRLTKLESLLYPITLKGWPFDSGRPEPTASGLAARKVLVLDLDSGRDYSAWACTELARGPGFSLLVVGGEGTRADAEGEGR